MLVKTVDTFRYRWNNYKINSRNYDCNQHAGRRIYMNITQMLVAVKFKNMSQKEKIIGDGLSALWHHMVLISPLLFCICC